MISEYHMPKLAMAMNEGTINEWLVAEGQRVEAGAPIAVIETEKVAYDCESPETGYFLPIVAEGETVDVEVLIGCFCSEETEIEEARQRYLQPAEVAADAIAEAPKTVPAETAGSSSQELANTDVATAELPVAGRIKASPAARKLARTNNIELQLIRATGPGGRIVKRDVLAAVAEVESCAPEIDQPGTVLARIPFKGLRRTIAARMSESLAAAAQVSGHFEADVGRLLEVRARLVDRAEQVGTRVSVNALLIKAIVTAIREVPQVNACVEGDEVVVYGNINMGIATSVAGSGEFDSGLLVAVLHDVGQMGLVEIDREMKALIGRVREGQATPRDLSGSTITLSSTAGIGPPGLTSTPVLNRPNVFMIGPSTPIERVRPSAGEYLSAPMLPISYTFDHRAIDGEPTARFLAALNDVLETPELMLA